MEVCKKFTAKLAGLFLFLMFLLPCVAYAETTNNLWDMGSTAVSSNKQWTIKFNEPVNFNKDTSGFITVTDEKSNTDVQVSEALGDDKKSIIVNSPSGGYSAGQTYSLNVKNGITAQDGSVLKQNVKLNFYINKPAEVSSITGVDDTIKLVSGQTLKLAPQALDASGSTESNVSFQYSSNNSQIASVSQDGTITAVSDGSTIVNITCGDKTKQVIVNVSDELSVKDIATKYSDAVVYVEVYDKNNKATASGSGFVIKSDGEVVTNYHVIDGAFYAKVTMEDGRQFAVDKVISASREHDIAVLQLKGASNLNTVVLGDSSKLAPGDKVVAIGSPGGIQFQNTVTDGIVSGLRTSGRSASGVQDLQISASIYHGSSGGALFNDYGQVVGITYAGSTEVPNVNFAIPINELNDVLSVSTNKTLGELASMPPLAPTGLVISKSYGGCKISWNSNTESNIAGYYLYESDNPNSGFTKVAISDGWFDTSELIQATSVRVTGGDPGETDYFYVTAVNTNGIESAKSQVVSISY